MPALFADLAPRLVVTGVDPLPVPAQFSYDPADPYAVTVCFDTGGESPITWTFARSLLTDGMSAPVGLGDVRVQPVRALGHCVIRLALSSPSGAALFEIDRDELDEFLRRTYAQVPAGLETDHFDLDASLALLLWSETEG